MKKNALLLLMIFVIAAATSCSDYMDSIADDTKDDPEMNLDNGLIAYWPVVEASGSSVKDYSSNNKDLLLHNITFDTGKYRTAMYLNGSNTCYANISSPNIFESKNSFTISMWAKIPFDAPNGRLILFDLDKLSLSYGESTNPYLSLRASIEDGVTAVSTGSINITSDQWVYLAVVFTGETLSLYINGSLEKCVIANITLPAIDALRLGAYYSESEPARGLYDEFRIYNRALSENEIKALMNTGTN